MCFIFMTKPITTLCKLPQTIRTNKLKDIREHHAKNKVNNSKQLGK